MDSSQHEKEETFLEYCERIEKEREALGEYPTIEAVYDGERELRGSLELPLSESELEEIKRAEAYVNNLFEGKQIKVNIIENKPSNDYKSIGTPDYAKELRTHFIINVKSDNEKIVLGCNTESNTKYMIADKKKFKKQPCVEFYFYKTIDSKKRVRYSLLASSSGVFFRRYRCKDFGFFEPYIPCVSYENITSVIENQFIPALNQTKNCLWNAME